MKNNTHRFLVFLLILITLIFITIKWSKLQSLLETFIVTVDEVILGSQCPDYLAFNGSNYYLVFNNKEFDGINNPLVFDSIEEVKSKLVELECPTEPFIRNMVQLRAVRNNDDPQEDLERRCSKHVALNLAGIDKCAFEYAHSTPELSKEFSSISTEQLGKLDNSSLNSIEDKVKTMSGGALDNYKMIRKLVQFINQNDESVMVDYDIETCMFERVGDLFNGQPGNKVPQYLKQQELGTKKNIHKFRKHFGQQMEQLEAGADVSSLENESGYLDEQSMSGFIKYFNDANEVIEDKVIDKLF